MPHTIYLALGSNLGNPKDNIERALHLLKKSCSNIKLSRLYESDPVYETNQNKFLNMALMAQTNLSPQELLTFCQEIENQVGRTKTFKNGPRVIDIDILFYDDHAIKDPDLTIPHPLIFERLFVLYPLMDIAKGCILPHQSAPLDALVKKAELSIKQEQRCIASSHVIEI